MTVDRALGADSLGVDSLGSVGLLPFSSFPGLPLSGFDSVLGNGFSGFGAKACGHGKKSGDPSVIICCKTKKFQPSACLRLLTGQAPQRGTPTMSKRRAQTTVWRTLQITTTTTCSRDMLKPKLKTFAYIICNVIFCGGQNSNDRHHVENCILT